MRKRRTLSDLYLFPGFKPKKTVDGVFGDSHARVIKLRRRGKKLSAASAARFIGTVVIAGSVLYGTCLVVMPESTSNWKFGVSSVGGVAK